jgi:hypothetical protein
MEIVQQSGNSNNIISKENITFMENEESVSKKFKFELLANIFRTGICDPKIGAPSNGWLTDSAPSPDGWPTDTATSPDGWPTDTATSPDHQSVGDNILKLWQIWFYDVFKNVNQEFSDIDSQRIWSTLETVACCMAENYETFGRKFKRKIGMNLKQKRALVKKSDGK